MHPVIQKTFGGLEPRYYYRHLFFGLLMAIFSMVVTYSNTPMSKPGAVIALVFFTVIVSLNTFLYPYARFVYESVVGFIVGDTMIFGNLFFMLAIKVATMILCWGLAIFIAPLGLIYLYFHHSRSAPSAGDA